MISSIILFLFILIGLAILSKKSKGRLGPKLVFTGWALKLLAGFSFFWVYTNYYGNGELSQDAGAYVYEARVMNAIFEESPGTYFQVLFNLPGHEPVIQEKFGEIPYCRFLPTKKLIYATRNHIKFTSIILLFFNDEPAAVFLIMLFISYLGLLYLWGSFAFLNLSKRYFALFFAPSILFWTSGILKESTLLLGLCLILPVLFLHLRSKKTWFFAILGATILLFTKPYILAILLSSYVLVRALAWLRTKEKKYWMGALLLVVVLFSTSLPKLALDRISNKQYDFINDGMGGIHLRGDTCNYYLPNEKESFLTKVGEKHTFNQDVTVRTMSFDKKSLGPSIELKAFQDTLPVVYSLEGGKSYFPIKPIDYKWTNLLISIPESFINACFRPFPWEKGNTWMNLFFFLETSIYFLLVIFVMKEMKWSNPTSKQSVFILLVFSLILTLVIGLTTPISGAIVRYRIPIQICILTAFLLTRSKHLKDV